MTLGPDALRAEQRAVAMRMAAAAIVAIVALSGALLWGPGSGSQQRLTVLAAAIAVAAAWLAAGIGNVARMRFFSAQDIAGSAGGPASAAVLGGNAVVQNSLEQVALAVPVYVATAVVIDRAAAVLAVDGVLFSVGRGLFWLGYARGARGRALGFALTFYPTVLTLLVVVVTLVGRAI